MFVFHGKRCIAGRELVGTKTSGSTLSNACSRSFIAYLAKSAAVAYGEVDCSSALTEPAIARLKQAARSLFMVRTPAFSIRFCTPRQAEFSEVLVRSRAAPEGIQRDIGVRCSCPNLAQPRLSSVSRLNSRSSVSG